MWLGLSLFALIMIGIAILLPVLAVIDLIVNRNFTVEKKIFWVIVIFIIPYLGSIFYFLFGRR